MKRESEKTTEQLIEDFVKAKKESDKAYEEYLKWKQTNNID